MPEKYTVSDVSLGDESYEVPVGQLKRGNYISIQNRPCKISHIARRNSMTSYCYTIQAYDIFTGKKYTTALGCCDDVAVPVIHKKKYVIYDMDDNYCYLQSANVTCRCPLPSNELRCQIRCGLNESNIVYVTVLCALGVSRIVAVNRCC